MSSLVTRTTTSIAPDYALFRVVTTNSSFLPAAHRLPEAVSWHVRSVDGPAEKISTEREGISHFQLSFNQVDTEFVESEGYDGQRKHRE